MVFNIEKSEIFYDARREKNNRRKLLDTNPANDYQIFLRTIMDKAEKNNEVRKGERENHIDIHSDDACSNEDDPQCALFLRSLKPRGQSYVLETNKNGAPLITEYEVESCSQEECEAVRRKKKTCSGVDQIGTSKRDKVEKVIKVIENEFVPVGVCSEYRSHILNEMRKPYKREEYNKLKHDVEVRKQIERHMDLRNGRERSYSFNKYGKSLLDHYPDLLRKLNEVQGDRRKGLKILRGIFFWLQNVSREEAFRPWRDSECLAVVHE